MIRKGILIETSTNYRIIGEIEYDDRLIEGMYYRDVNKPSKEGANLVFAAFVFPIENKDKVAELLRELAESKKRHDDTVARIFYKEFPKINGRNI